MRLNLSRTTCESVTLKAFDVFSTSNEIEVFVFLQISLTCYSHQVMNISMLFRGSLKNCTARPLAFLQILFCQMATCGSADCLVRQPTLKPISVDWLGTLVPGGAT